jgi:transposase
MAKPKRYELTAEQWRRVEDLLPGKSGDPGRSGADNLTFVNGVLWVLRSGAHWHDLPELYGNWKTAHKRFTRWTNAGVWERVFAHLIDDPDNGYVSLDSSPVPATIKPPAERAAAKKAGSGTEALPCRTWPVALPSILSKRMHHKGPGSNT